MTSRAAPLAALLLWAASPAAAGPAPQETDIGLKVNDGAGVKDIAVQPGGSSPVKIQKGGQSYGVMLVPPNDPDATRIRVATPGGVMAMKKYNPPPPCTPGTVGSSPFQLVGRVRNAIQSRNLPYTGLGNSPILRSSGGSGGGRRWTNHGTFQIAALTEICQILGFTSYTSSTCADGDGAYPDGGKCYWHSPGDNSIQVLNAATNRFSTQSAGDKYTHTWLATITCGCN